MHFVSIFLKSLEGHFSLSRPFCVFVCWKYLSDLIHSNLLYCLKISERLDCLDKKRIYAKCLLVGVHDVKIVHPLGQVYYEYAAVENAEKVLIR